MDFFKQDKRPLYLKIKEHIENLIDQEIYEAGDKLPSETSFAKKLNVSRASLREALRVLEKEGKIIKSQGVGTFVSKPIPRFKKGITELFSVTDTIKNEGFEPGTKDLKILKESLKKKLALKMNLAENEEILKIERVRTADKMAVVYCIDYLNTNIFPIDKNVDFSGSLFSLLENNYNLNIKYAVTKIVPITAKRKLIEKLNVKKFSPILLLDQMHYDSQERLFLYSKNYFRADQFQFKVLRKRQ